MSFNVFLYVFSSHPVNEDKPWITKKETYFVSEPFTHLQKVMGGLFCIWLRSDSLHNGPISALWFSYDNGDLVHQLYSGLAIMNLYFPLTHAVCERGFIMSFLMTHSWMRRLNILLCTVHNNYVSILPVPLYVWQIEITFWLRQELKKY